MGTGKVYLVGAGPGAPDLLTVRAMRVLSRAEIVFHDALINKEVLTTTSTVCWRKQCSSTARSCGSRVVTRVSLVAVVRISSF